MEKDIIKLKAELLCLGARVEAETAKQLAAAHRQTLLSDFCTIRRLKWITTTL